MINVIELIIEGDLEVYEQVEFYKEPSFLRKLFSSEDEPQEVEFYLTITSDGILKSTKNLMEAKM